MNNFETPLGPLPQSQIILGRLNELRAQRKRLRADDSIKENERQQEAVKQQLISMGKEYLIHYQTKG